MNEYLISFPPETDRQIIEWFEFMKSQNCLSAELIKLVKQHISSEINETHSAVTTVPQSNNRDIFENLYNWQDANNNTFVEVKKQKKKMLTV